MDFSAKSLKGTALKIVSFLRFMFVMARQNVTGEPTSVSAKMEHEPQVVKIFLLNVH